MYQKVFFFRYTYMKSDQENDDVLDENKLLN